MTHDVDVSDSPRAYGSEAVVAHYASQLAQLHPGEVALLERYADDIDGRRILDIGVGAGRTIPFLAPRAARYAALDYVEELVSVARHRHPDADVRVGDVRHLDAPNASVDFALFSFNGLDSVDHADRQRALSEMNRVLAPGGRLLFSSHNLHFSGVARPPWRVGRPGRRMLRQSLNHLRHTSRRRAMARQEIAGDGWARVNDGAHDYALVIYYITPAEQLRQLHASGFEQVEIFDQWGHEACECAQSLWMYYSARKGG